MQITINLKAVNTDCLFSLGLALSMATGRGQSQLELQGNQLKGIILEIEARGKDATYLRQIYEMMSAPDLSLMDAILG